MAAGENVSASSQTDAEQADLARETREPAETPVAEPEELTMIYVERGLDRDPAEKAAVQLAERDALGSHARDKLGISETVTARPIHTALASALTFAVGAVVPLIVVLVATELVATETRSSCSWRHRRSPASRSSAVWAPPPAALVSFEALRGPPSGALSQWLRQRRWERYLALWWSSGYWDSDWRRMDAMPSSVKMTAARSIHRRPDPPDAGTKQPSRRCFSSRYQSFI
ncbi:VIT1/CCC1 transporter family protein [Roseibacterium beibuensis]|nr:VIT1/CCC1 transporter family protein [Roseibacterium beibuensis]MCS6621285.1 VIT1/CCC1 transporter family protein [Roseibacterium beibuensis]